MLEPRRAARVGLYANHCLCAFEVIFGVCGLFCNSFAMASVFSST